MQKKQSFSVITVSCNGTWQRRGLVSKKGVAKVLSMNPGGAPKIVLMLECCGHVQKRMGRRLVDLKNANKRKVLEEDDKHHKGMGGEKKTYSSSNH
ncbi:hypothetical protein BgiBS90_019257 [Biomphalaria glabrata]|nr:hypothetical protein BgiBS90_019257 [Biomphalaria glabrata]